MNINCLSTRTNKNNKRRKQEHSQTNTDTEDRRQGHHNSLESIRELSDHNRRCRSQGQSTDKTPRSLKRKPVGKTLAWTEGLPGIDQRTEWLSQALTNERM